MKKNPERRTNRVGVYIDRAKIRLEEEKHPGYIDSLIKMFDDVIGDKKEQKMKKEGFYWHIHHDRLVEYCYDYAERAGCIKRHKPQGEVADRLRLMQPVKGKLPDVVIKACQALNKAEKTLMENTSCSACLEHRRQKKIYSAKRAFFIALRNNKEAIEKLHAEECPNCIWNGRWMNFK